MSLNRIQKLLYSEYCDFEDVVLIESPFAEVNRNGNGLRQVQVGLTSTKMILATEMMKNVDEYSIFFFPGMMDPEIESMELITIVPLEYVSLTVWQKRRRRILKAKFHDGDPTTFPKIILLELGGLTSRRMFWNLWCEKVKFLSPNSKLGSGTEESVASSASSASLQLSRTRIAGDKVWHYYEPLLRTPHGADMTGNMTRELVERTDNNDTELKTIYMQSRGCQESSSTLPTPVCLKNTSQPCGCVSCSKNKGVGLNFAYTTLTSSDFLKRKYLFKDFEEFCDQCVDLWTCQKMPKCNREYAFNPCPDLNNCVGIITSNAAGKFTMQRKRSKSEVTVTEERQNVRKMADVQRTRGGVPGSQSEDNMAGQKLVSHQVSSDDCAMGFWTTDYWFHSDRVARSLAHYRAWKHEELSKKKQKLFFGRKRGKSSDDVDELPIVKLKAFMTMSGQWTVWDLDSTSLANQITIMDSQLFIKIPVQELRFLKRQGSARNCRNLMTWLVFKYRVSCLVATTILLAKDTQRRARLVARFILTCEKCHRQYNHQSTSSILAGLQTPAIYRLKLTWARVKKYHSTAYSVFKKLCTDYSEPSLPDLNTPAFIPNSQFFTDAVFGKLSVENWEARFGKQVRESSSWADDDEVPPTPAIRSIMKNILSVVGVVPAPPPSSRNPPSTVGTMKTASDFFSPRFMELSEVEKILRICQKAARKFEISPSKEANDFLQKLPYYEHNVSFQFSLKVEPPHMKS